MKEVTKLRRKWLVSPQQLMHLTAMKQYTNTLYIHDALCVGRRDKFFPDCAARFPLPDITCLGTMADQIRVLYVLASCKVHYVCCKTEQTAANPRGQSENAKISQGPARYKPHSDRNEFSLVGGKAKQELLNGRKHRVAWIWSNSGHCGKLRRTGMNSNITETGQHLLLLSWTATTVLPSLITYGWRLCVTWMGNQPQC